ncbi:MAG: hypothetical protein AAB019_03285 [Planctomycetota bacterium]
MPSEVAVIPLSEITPITDKTEPSEATGVVKEPEAPKELELPSQPEIVKEPETTNESEVTKELEVVKESEVTKEKEPEVATESHPPKEPEITKEPETLKETPPVYQLQPVLKEGNKFAVAEEQKWDGDMVIAVGDKAQRFPFLTLIKHEYTEEIMSVQDGLKVKREYTLSQKKTNLPNEGTKTEPISFHKKAMILEIKNGEIKVLENLSRKEGDVLTQDLAQLTCPGDFNAILPTKTVTVGEQWDINSELFMRTALKNYYQKELCRMSGSAQLARIIESQGMHCAEILVKINLVKNADKDSPAFDVALNGFCYFALDYGYILTLELTGPFKMNGRRISELNEIVETTVAGSLTVKLNAKLK